MHTYIHKYTHIYKENSMGIYYMFLDVKSTYKDKKDISMLMCSNVGGSK